MADSKYNFKEIEEKWKNFWEKEKIFEFNPINKKNIYSIDTPPPYISGKMHIGHAFSYSQQDFIIRFQRMFLANKNGGIFYPFGTDDNGLPTERFIEKTKNVKSKNMGRADFIDLCIKTLKEITPDCIQDFKNLGISADYNVYYSTIDDNSRKISQKSFIDLYKSGEAYQKEFPTMWCPECQTSIAQAELEDKNEKSLFSTLKFSCENKNLPIATTRPELLGACVAVFVHPSDKKYSDFVGKKARVPLFNFEVPIIKDASADPNKGTGALMVCSYGDKYDVDAINRHKLIPKIILDTSGRVNFGEYKGLKIKEARKKILEDLKKENLILEQKEINHVVNCHDKCGQEIEFIPTNQWFIKILDKKKKFIEQGNKIKWYPEFMHKRYDNWVNGLEWDWSISRNRHFGVPIPVWKCRKCNEIILAKEKELPVDPLQIKKNCPKCKSEAEPEKMVFDTWATSSLTPQIASSLIKNKVVIPYSLRPQGHDIIRTWAFYTIVKSYLHENKIPWKEIVISGNVSLGGEKMSKSKGNVVSPIDIMDKYGSDALRFWAAGSKLGNDLDYQEKDLMAGTKMINKIINASRFVFMNLGDYHFKKPKKLEKLDELFLNKLNYLVKNCTDEFKKYEYSRVKQEVEQFFWKDFCDNYLEIVKKRIYQGEGNLKLSAQYTLYKSLLTILKLISPIMPFISEEIYQEYFKRNEKIKSIHLSSWPEFNNKEKENKKDSEILDKLYFIISQIRQEKSKQQKPMNSEIALTLRKEDYEEIKSVLEDLKNVSNA
ncbi:MAG TPA: valine--tRNA ligase, partial [Candidatus Pacearchaeota archaeon]|nr:valine--tRNA ligase [Candidatus Pacearchaeota archaeon]